MKTAHTHVAYSDESQWNTKRYRALGMVTLCAPQADAASVEFDAVLRDSNVREFKWTNLSTARHRFAATKLIDEAFKCIDARCLRIDVLIWDVHDSRHSVIGRDDVANYERMFYHLARNVMSNRWPDDALWALHPDEHSQIDWANLHAHLDNKAHALETRHDLFTHGETILELRQYFNIDRLQECSSHSEPLVQLADLFAGMAAYSYGSFDALNVWRTKNSAQMNMPEVCEESVASLSAADKERCFVLDYFDRECKTRRLRVALNSTKGLYSHQPENAPNFWLYQPQVDEDKAPVKSRVAMSERNPT